MPSTDEPQGYCLACGQMVDATGICDNCAEAWPEGWPSACAECGKSAQGYHLCCTGFLCLLCYQLHELTGHGVPDGESA